MENLGIIKDFITIGAVIFMAGKLSQTVRYLEKAVDKLTEIDKEHDLRLRELEQKNAGRK